MATFAWSFVGICSVSLLLGLIGMVKGRGDTTSLFSFGVVGLGIAGCIYWIMGLMPSMPEAPKDPLVEACRKDFRQCTSQEQLVDHYGDLTKGKTSCKIAAKGMARFGDPDFPFFAFGSYFSSERSFETGRIELIETEAKYQNGYGAMQRTRVKCIYDLANKKVLDVIIAPQ
jgi:hypothetical protein